MGILGVIAGVFVNLIVAHYVRVAAYWDKLAVGAIEETHTPPAIRDIRAADMVLAQRWYVLLLCGAFFAYVAWRWGTSRNSFAWYFFGPALLCLAVIDAKTMYLPDAITLPLVWAGLSFAGAGFTGLSMAESFWGASAGYMGLWGVFWVFKLFTGLDGLGQGDFKLLAALGAWFGAQALLPIVLIASFLGVCYAVLKRRYGQVPFGPSLVMAGLLVLLLGPQQLIKFFVM
jgi:leader peptidase (prepilin peptidase)/N-methyltransferase